MSESMYYIVSLKHTSKGDTALTFWGPNHNGYKWHRKMVGLYNEKEAMEIKSEDAVPVLKEIVDPFWMNALDFNDKYVSVPNTPTVLYHLGLQSSFMKPKKCASCTMTFINTPVLEKDLNPE